MNVAIIAAVTAAISKIKGSKMAEKLNIDDNIIDAISSYFQTDKILQKELASIMQKSIKHDEKLMEYNSRFINNLRGIIRPLCTLGAFSWYIYARANNVQLSVEDYSIIGGILAFWFGFRPYEKSQR